MRRLILCFTVSAVLVATSAWAQITPPPAQNPPAQTAPTPTPTPTPVPFPADAKVAYVIFERVLQESKLGQAGMAEMKALQDKLLAPVNEKSKAVKALQDKIQAQQNVANDAALNQMNRDLAKQQQELQFMAQDMDAQLGEKNQELLDSFQQKVLPIVEQIRNERGLWMIFALSRESGIAAAHAGLDLSAELIKRLDSGK